MTKTIKPNTSSKALKEIRTEYNKLKVNVKKNLSQELENIDSAFLETIIEQTIYSSCKENDFNAIQGCLAALVGINPKDDLELMLAAQMVSIHNISMEMSRRALFSDQTVEGVNNNINRVTKLMRTFTQQIEALQKHRAKGNQKITVQHVQVNNGGKAVIGDINQGGGNE